MAKSEQDLAAYIAGVRGQYIDVDGVFGAQCWDQFSHYAMWLGVPHYETYTNAFGYMPHPGYACNVYHHSWNGLTGYFDILGPGATPRAGDVAFWDYGSGWYPWSHVATVLSVTVPGRLLRCLTQNPGHVQIADLIVDGVIGYLRPRNLVVGDVDTSKTPSFNASDKQQEEEMAGNNYIAKIEKGKQINAIVNTDSGFFHPFESADGQYNTKVLKAFDVKSPSGMLTVSQFNAVEAACKAVRRKA